MIKDHVMFNQGQFMYNKILIIGKEMTTVVTDFYAAVKHVIKIFILIF